MPFFMPVFDLIRRSKRYDYWVTFLLLLTLLVLRSSSRLLDPVIWAEDGVFISGLLRNGFLDIFKAEFGYYQIIQRFICWCVMLFSVKLWPLLLTISCFFIYAAIFSVFSKTAYEDILPSRLHRILACTVFAFLPGTQEILGNTPNLGWVLTVYVGLVIIKKLGHKPLGWELGFSMACMSGAGQTVILLPLLIYRLYLTLDSKFQRDSEFQRYFLLLIMQLLFIVLNFLARSNNVQYGPGKLPSLLDLGIGWWFGTMNGMIVQPLLGTHWTHVLGASVQPAIWLIAGCTAAFTTYLFSTLEQHKKLGIAFVLSWSTAILLCSLVRGWGIQYYINPVFVEDSRARSSFVLGAGALFLWFSILPHLIPMIIPKLKRNGKTLARWGIPGYCLWYFLLNGAGDNFFITSFRALRSETQWSNHYAPLDASLKTGCPPQYRIAIEPPGWQIDYQSPRNADCS